MKKKIIALSAALMLFAGVVSASSINGDYKGSPIVKIMSNGKQLETDEVPAVILDGHTVVPISTLRQLGASVTWDAYGYAVDVKLPGQTGAVNGGVDGIIQRLGKAGENIINYAQYVTMGDGYSQISIGVNFKVDDLNNTADYNKVMNEAINSGAYQLKMEDNNLEVFIYIKDAVDFKNGTLSADEFNKKTEVKTKTNSAPPQAPISQPQQPINPVNNGSNVQQGDTGNFEFIGVNDFLDKNGYLHVAGQVKNTTGDNTVGGVEITITLFDQNGNVVGTQSGYAKGASTFRNGETASFDITFFYVPDNYTRYVVKAKS